MKVSRIHPSLSFNSPVAIMDLPGCDRRLILQQDGRIFSFERSDNVDHAELAIDIGRLVEQSGAEQMAAARDATLDPRFEQNGFVYVVWSIREMEVAGGSRVSRFQFSDDLRTTIDPESRLDLISYHSGDHIGASLNFGPDQMLYITTGDGARPFPPDAFRTAQDLSDLRGSVLRIDVRDGTDHSPYQIPPDNPFVNLPGARGEIYAFGIRNGFRAAFDPQTDDLWVADVGWERCEMVHHIRRGGNHGWSLYEGPYPVEPTQPSGPGERIEPAIVMPRTEAQSITGGTFDSATNRYVFGCYMNGNVWMADVENPDRPEVRKVASTGLRIVDFCNPLPMASSSGDAAGVLDQNAAMLVLDYGGGGVYELVDNQAAGLANVNFPTRLSETGLFENVTDLKPAPGVVQYHPVATMYRDGAVGSRVVAAPTTERIAPHKNRYPTGTALANTISQQIVADDGADRMVHLETQVLLFDGLNWNPYTYRWNDAQTDADLVPAAGSMQTIRIRDPIWGVQSLEYQFMARDQCLTCHHVFNQGASSLRPENLWHDREWDRLAEQGIFEPAASTESDLMVNSADPSRDLETRARSYLAANCSHCHRPAGGATSGLDLQRHVDEKDMMAINAVAVRGDFGIAANQAHIISPGHPESSVLMYRVATAGPGSMPRMGTCRSDLENSRMLWDWIASMEPTSDSNQSTFVSNVAAPPDQPSETIRWMNLWRKLVDLPADQAVVEMRREADIEQDPIAAGLLQPWIEPTRRRQVVGDSPDIDEILAIDGDAQAGRVWYHFSAAAQCRQCHSCGPTTLQFNPVGPDLVEVATRRTPRELLQHIINPHLEILPKWQTTNVLTWEGRIVTGLVTKRDDELVTLRQTDGTSITVAVDDIESETLSPKSMMPVGTLSTLTPVEVANLVAFMEDAAAESKRSGNQAEVIDFGSHKDCPVLQNEHVRVVLLPDSGGRIIEYSLDGDNSMFVSNHDLGTYDESDTSQEEYQSRWINDPSGGRFDVGPEMMIPKRPETFFGVWSAERISPLRVRLTSPVAEEAGIQLVRDFELDATSSRLSIEQRVTNISKQPIQRCHWSRTLVDGAGICVIPLSGFQRYPQHYLRYESNALNYKPSDPAVTARGEYLLIDGPPEFSKLGIDSLAGWMAHYQSSGQLFIKQFPTYPNRVYGEIAAFPIATWTPPTGETIEMEPIGPLETIAAGETVGFTEIWHLIEHDYPGDSPSVDLEQLQSLVDELPPPPWQTASR